MALSRKDRGVENNWMEQQIHLAQLKRQERHYNDTVPERDQVQWLDSVPRLTLPAKSPDQWPTQLNLEAIYLPPSSYVVGDTFASSEQITWMLPALREASISSKSAAHSSGAEGYVSILRKLAQSSGIYAVASLASPLIALVLGPFLTHTLSHTDYGALAVLNTVIVLMAAITQLGLSSAFFRTYSHDYESPKDRLAVLSTAVILLLLVSIPWIVATMITAPQLAVMLFHDPALGNAIRLAAVVVLLQNFAVPGFSWLRAENHPTWFVVLAVGNLLVSLGATIIFVGMLHMGIAGSLLATAAGYTVIVMCTLPIILLRAGLRLRFDIAWNLLSFGLPSVSSLVSVWVLQLSDRYLLSYFGSLSETASYTVAYTLGGALSPVAIAPFSLAWYAIMYTIAKREDAGRVFQLVFRWYSIVLLFAVFALSLVATGALNILFPPSYHATAPVIPIVAISTMFYGVYNVLAVGMYIQRKTWIGSILTTLAALINIGFNIVLIPPYGVMGAAASTLLAYVLLALMAYVVNQRIYPIPFEVYKFLIALLIGIVLYVGSSMLAHTQDTYTGWVIPICGLGLYGGCLAFLGKLSARSYQFKRLES